MLYQFTIKAKIRTYGDEFYTNSRRLDVPEDGVEYKLFTIISIHSSLVYENKYYLPFYLDKCAYKIVNTQMINKLDNNLFQFDKN